LIGTRRTRRFALRVVTAAALGLAVLGAAAPVSAGTSTLRYSDSRSADMGTYGTIWT
jgi:hypothetical protein